MIFFLENKVEEKNIFLNSEFLYTASNMIMEYIKNTMNEKKIIWRHFCEILFFQIFFFFAFFIFYIFHNYIRAYILNFMFLKKYFSSTLFSKKNIFFKNYEIQYICSNIIMEYVENKKKVKKKIIWQIIFLIPYFQ